MLSLDTLVVRLVIRAGFIKFRGDGGCKERDFWPSKVSVPEKLEPFTMKLEHS
jgi:hypothetical protein